MDTEQSNKY